MFRSIKIIFQPNYLMFFTLKMENFACFSCISSKNLVSLQRNKTSRKHGFYSQKRWHFLVVSLWFSCHKSMVYGV